MIRSILTLALATASLPAAEKKPITCHGSNTNIKIEAVAFLDKESIKQTVGIELGASIVAVEVTVTPRAGKPVKIFQDDFILRSYKDGQKSQPFAASQLAGSGALVLVATQNAAGSMYGNQNGPVWGGVGGGGPQRLPGNGSQVGNGASTESIEARAKDEAQEAGKNKEKPKEDPKLVLLKQKALPETETDQPVKGFLYFPLEGKHKAKDLALSYQGQAGKLTLEFQ